MQPTFVSMTVLSLCTLFAGYPPPGDYKHNFKIEQSYDEFRGDTSLKLDLETVMILPSNRVDFSFHMHYKGQMRADSKNAPALMIFNHGIDGWRYLKYHSIVVLADEQKFNFEPKHDGNVETGYVTEILWVKFNRSQFESIANAKRVRIAVGEDRYEFTGAELAAIKDYASYLDNSNFVVSTLNTKSAYRKAVEAVDDGDDDKARALITSFRENYPRTYEAKISCIELLNRINDPIRIANRETAAAAKAKAEAEQAEAQAREIELKTKKLKQEKAETKLRLAKSLEATNAKGAIGYYQEIIKDFPGTAEAKRAAERVRAIEKK